MDWLFKYNEDEKVFEKFHQELGELADDEVAIRPLSVGICGSDLHKISHNVKSPALLHEWVGVVLESGSVKSPFKTGDIVTSMAQIRCGCCKSCTSKDRAEECYERRLLGGPNSPSVLSSRVHLKFSDVITLNREQDHLEQVLLEVAFIGDCAFHRAERLGLKKDMTIIIFGAGPVGIFTALALRERGFKSKLVEVSKERIAIAKKLDLSIISFAEALISGNDHDGNDFVIDCTGDSRGSGAIKHLAKFAKIDGHVVIVGKYQDGTIDEGEYAGKSLSVTWVANHSEQAFRESLDFWRNKMKPFYKELMTTFSSHKINDALEAAFKATDMKCVIDFSQDKENEN